MQPSRIAELLEPFLSTPQLTTKDLESISMYIDILLRWNTRINLTAIRGPEQIVTRHFGESLFAARNLFPNRALVGADASSAPAKPGSAASQAKAESVADFGSGAGFPGLPIKLWVPQISLTLIESNHKKAAFLREATRVLTLTNVNVLSTRAEKLSGASFDLVTLRAVERFETVLPIAANLLTPGGRLALLIGSTQLKPAYDALPHLTWSDSIPIPLSNNRILTIARRP